MNSDLLPCPFCGGLAETGFEDSHSGGHVKCSDCGVVGPVWSNDTEEAVVGWNKRAPDRKSFDAGYDWAMTMNEAAKTKSDE